MATQIPLDFEFGAGQGFDRYFAGVNAEAVANLRASAQGHGQALIYLWGEQGIGKTHLLRASCQLAHHYQRQHFFLPLRQLIGYPPAILEGLEHMDLVCVDDLECIAGQRQWEQAFFHFFNRHRDNGGHLILAARHTPQQTGIRLPDLLTRLSWGLTLRLQNLDDNEKLAALSLHADSLGLELSPQVGRFLLNHYPRDLASLWQLMEQLNRASLAEQRRLTIPFLKSFLDQIS